MQSWRREQGEVFLNGHVHVAPAAGDLGGGDGSLQLLEVSDAGRHLDLGNGGRRVADLEQRKYLAGPFARFAMGSPLVYHKALTVHNRTSL